mgnify:CR=1 FL=1
MPDYNSSLPQIAPESVAPQVSKPTAPVQPINSDLAGQENASLGGGERVKPPRIFPLKKILAVLVLVAIILISYFMYFVWIPKSQAKSYVEQTSADFFKINEKLVSVKSLASPFEDTSTSFEIAKGVYFGVGQPLIYVHSSLFLDAKEDLDRVKSVQLLIIDAKHENEKFRVGSDVRTLDKNVDLYLDKLEDGMNKLYLFENFRIDMLNAIGEEQAREVEKLAEVYSAKTERAAKVEYVEKLAVLMQSSTERLKALGNVPNDTLSFYNLTVEMQEDMGATLAAMQKDYGVSSADGDNQAILKLSGFGRRQLERNSKATKASVEVAKNSETGKILKEAVEVEQEVKKELGRLREEFKIEAPGPN